MPLRILAGPTVVHHDPHIIPRNLRRVAKFLRAVEVITAHEVARAGLSQSAEWLDNAARHIEREQNLMGKYAEKISALESAVTGLRADKTHLQAQLADAQANQADSADKAAADGVDAFLADTTVGGAGGDTTAGGTGADTTGAQP